VAQYVAAACKGDSYISFSGNSEGYCTAVTFDNDSTVAPKGP
jgi:hypothetical protein